MSISKEKGSPPLPHHILMGYCIPAKWMAHERMRLCISLNNSATNLG